MIVPDSDILVKLRNSDTTVIRDLQQYHNDEWTTTSHVAHNKNDFDNEPLHDLVDVDVVPTES